MDSELHSKKDILKSTGVLGSVQAINIVIGVVRTKILAVLLGPVGVGIAGIYQTTVSIISSATGFGINYSGVRDIASAAASADETRIGRNVRILRQWAWTTGILGALIALIFCKPLAHTAFNDESYASGIAILSVTLLLSALTGATNALMQGMRRINQMAKANLTGVGLGLAGSIAAYFMWGFNGIIPALLITFLSAQLSAWYFSRQIEVKKVNIGWSEAFREGLPMVRLGFFMVVAALMNNLFMYVVRAFVVKEGGLGMAGYFIAAWTISSTYIAAVFNAMGADFYPKLCGVQEDNAAVKRIVNEQTEVALLLTVPLIIGIISFISLFVDIFYSRDFDVTAEILRWQLFGDFFKVLGYPAGFILLAKAKGGVLVIVELLWNLIFLGSIYIGWDSYGLTITGIGFLAAYILYIACIYFIVKRLVSFSWSKTVYRYLMIFSPLMLLSFLSSLLLEIQWQQYAVGAVLFLISAIYSISQLRKIVDLNSILGKFKAIFIKK
ncbi:MAG: O-antigen translocase [Chitinophagaceae bacterium]|nr:MAG: O-antigen translocase [Chitinophagaceae bacterium]